MARRRIRGVFGLIALTVAAALVVAGIALPGVLLAGAATTTVAHSVRSLPDGIDPTSPPQPSVLYAADGTTRIATFYSQYRKPVQLKQVSKVMQQAMVAAEDRRFYEHGAVDAKGVLRAAAANIRNGAVDQGASTLTMQYVRNVLKNDQNVSAAERKAATQDTLSRKLQEVRYAAELEHTMSKDQILQSYLNIAYFGAGAYGIESAAQRFFSTPASRLTLAQAALLAGLVQSPDAYNPISRDQSSALSRRSYVLESMRTMGAITQAQETTAKAKKIGLHPKTLPTSGCTGVPADHNDWGFYCDYFVRWWNEQSAFGKTPQQRTNKLLSGGYRIITPMQPDVQATALEQSVGVYGYDDPKALPIAVVQPGTGRVLAMAVNRHYGLPKAGQNDVSTTVAPLISGGGGLTGYQAGSTFKMFTMLAALQNGMPLYTPFDAPSQLPTHWRDSGPNSCDGQYCPSNENPSFMDGMRTMWDGFGRSVNTYFVHLEEQVGADKAVAMAQKLGITFRAPSDQQQVKDAVDWGSFTLGVADTTPLDLAEAYATVAAERRSLRGASGHRDLRREPQEGPRRRRPHVRSGDQPGDRTGRDGRGALPGRPAVHVRAVQRRDGDRRQRNRRAAGRRQDRLLTGQRHRDVRRVHPAGGGGRDRGRPGGPDQRGRLVRLQVGQRGGRAHDRGRRAGSAGAGLHPAERRDRVRSGRDRAGAAADQAERRSAAVTTAAATTAAAGTAAAAASLRAAAVLAAVLAGAVLAAAPAVAAVPTAAVSRPARCPPAPRRPPEPPAPAPATAAAPPTAAAPARGGGTGGGPGNG